MNYIKKMRQDKDRLELQLENAMAAVARITTDLEDLDKILDKVKSLG